MLDSTARLRRAALNTATTAGQVGWSLNCLRVSRRGRRKCRCMSLVMKSPLQCSTPAENIHTKCRSVIPVIPVSSRIEWGARAAGCLTKSLNRAQPFSTKSQEQHRRRAKQHGQMEFSQRDWMRRIFRQIRGHLAAKPRRRAGRTVHSQMRGNVALSATVTSPSTWGQLALNRAIQ